MILLGSTGSIGVNALQIAKNFEIKVEALSAGRNITLLNEQIKAHQPRYVCIALKEDSEKLISGDYQLFIGDQGILELIESAQSSLVLNALVGFVGLAPSLKAIERNKHLALANKESLVTAGWLLQNTNLTPIDSEHFSLWHLLQNKHKFTKLYITASGGAFRDTPLESIPTATLQSALKHPNWKMGRKITIDSATMANKLFEILEAYWLFDTKDIDALIEPSSQLHALVQYADGSLSAHISHPDMRLPIAYALGKDKAMNSPLIPTLNLHTLQLKLQSIEISRYPLWQLQEEILNTPQKGIILNASNEIAVEAFLNNQISFGAIASCVLSAMKKFENLEFENLKDLCSIQELDEEVRAFARKELKV